MVAFKALKPVISITKLKYKKALIFFLFFTGSTTGFSSSKISNLNQYITEFVLQNSPQKEGEEVTVEILKLDSNFQLPPCEEDIKMAFAQEGIPTENNTITISCPSSPHWKVHIPIKVHVFTNVIAANHYISARTKISEDDLYFAKHDRKMLREGYFKDPNEIIGLFATHSLASGVVFTPKNVKQKAVIKRNQTIKLVLNHGGITIDMIGRAKSNGIINETIKVMNPSSKKIVDAVVTGNNRAEINL